MDEDERARRWRNAIDDLRVDKPNYDKYSIALGLLADAERERDRFLTRAAQERERADNIEAERDAARAEVATLRDLIAAYFTALDTLDWALDDDAEEAGNQFSTRVTTWREATDSLRAALAATTKEGA